METTLHGMRAGDEILMPDAGTHQTMTCPTCDTFMNVKRNVQRYSRWGGKPIEGQFCDVFQCPHAGERWHEQAIALKHLIRKTPSHTLANMLTEELNTVLKDRHPTKKDFRID